MLTDEQLEQVALEMDGDNTYTDIEQLRVLLNAYDVFLERNAVREDLWAEHPLEVDFRHVQDKMARIDQAQSSNTLPPDVINGVVLEEGLDIINYTVFMIRKATGKS